MAAAAFTMSRLPRFAAQARPYFFVACLLSAIGIVLHGESLFALILPGNGFDLSIGNAASMIGLELAVIALIAALEPTLRGMSAGLLVLAGVPEWWFVFGPFGAPLLLLAAALMIGHPESVWARTFYGERKMQRARQVHDVDTPTSVRR